VLDTAAARPRDLRRHGESRSPRSPASSSRGGAVRRQGVAGVVHVAIRRHPARSRGCPKLDARPSPPRGLRWRDPAGATAFLKRTEVCFFPAVAIGVRFFDRAVLVNPTGKLSGHTRAANRQTPAIARGSAGSVRSYQSESSISLTSRNLRTGMVSSLQVEAPGDSLCVAPVLRANGALLIRYSVSGVTVETSTRRSRPARMRGCRSRTVHRGA
jgi:hypothetical protein